MKTALLPLLFLASLSYAQHQEKHVLFSLKGVNLEAVIDSATEMGMTGERMLFFSGDKEIAKQIITHQNLSGKKHPLEYLKELLGQPDPEHQPMMAKKATWTNKKTGSKTFLTYWDYMDGAIYKREDRKFIDKHLNGTNDIYGDFKQVIYDKKIQKVWDVIK